MFKLVVLSALLAVAAAKPGGTIIEAISAPILKTAIIHEPGHIEVHEPTLAKVGEIVESVPTAISHQSSTIVHSRANQITPIIGPAVRTYSAPALKTYTTPLVESSPLLKTAYVAPSLGGYLQTPYLRSYDGGLATYGYSYAYGAPVISSAPYGYTNGAVLRSF